MNQVKEIKEVTRSIKPQTKMLLLAVTAGRCEICNNLVIKDSFTGKDIFYGEAAHIYAFNEGGARSKKVKLYDNNFKNLLLACPDCHTKIDKKGQVKYYSAEYLKRLKMEHEKRIKTVTGFNPHRRTKILRLMANIKNETVKISQHEIISALLPERLYPCEDVCEEIDFTSTAGLENSIYWKSKMQEADQILNKFYSDLKRDKIEHVCVFGLGPIPLLMYLGSKLDNKIATKLFQRHRDGEGWNWNKGKPKAEYKFNSVQKGKIKNRVALLLSLSGTVNRDLLPPTVKNSYAIYELAVNPEPNYNFLRSEKDLHNFETSFTTAISVIKNKHKGLKDIEMFPAVPAPIAIACGRLLNKNSDPRLKIFNTYSKNKFKYSLTIN